MDDVSVKLKTIKDVSYKLATIDEKLRAEVLLTLAAYLRFHSSEIIRENQKDLSLMAFDDPRYDRLELSLERINSIADDVEKVARLPTVLGKTLSEKVMPNGLIIKKIAVPLGVVAVIFESRPNVTIDVFALCFKTGNASVLKGGKEADFSNKILVSLIKKALNQHLVDENAVYLLPNDRSSLTQVLSAVGFVDVCIPRGGKALINFVRENAKVPVIETGAGIVHTYFDVSGDLSLGRLIINNAKTRRVSVCNALDTLIIHEQSLVNLFVLVELMIEKKVILYADNASYKVLKDHYPKELLHIANARDYGQEFLSHKMAIKTVKSVEEAVKHIRQYSSGHSEAIIANDEPTINYFLTNVDAAALYVNTSTAFTDGGQFGLGAEIGISTQKLHARGPMGLDALTSYKWVILGDGQIRE